MLASELALELMALAGLAVLIGGVGAVVFWTIPSTIRDLRGYEKDTPERILFEWDLRLALAALAKLLLLFGVVAVILLTEPSMLRSAITRPMLLIVLCLVAFTAILTPLRRRAIERVARRRQRDHD